MPEIIELEVVDADLAATARYWQTFTPCTTPICATRYPIC
jgi:hypothetical protein